eukprot:gene3721-3978_t
MSNEDYEVIELGDDGAFDIPSSLAVKQHLIEEIDYHSPEWQAKIIREENKDLLRSLKPSEFAVYQNENNLFWAIFRLPTTEDKIQGVLLQQSPNTLVLRTINGHQLAAHIDDNIKIDRNSLQCKVCKDYVTVTFSTA